MRNFTMIPNIILRNPNGLSHAEFRFLCCIYTMTAGFQRNTYRMNYPYISKMAGLAISKMSIYRKNLESTGYIECVKDGGSYIYKILPLRADSITPREERNYPGGSVYRGAKKNIYKDNKRDVLSYKEMTSLCINQGFNQESDFEQIGKNKFRRLK